MIQKIVSASALTGVLLHLVIYVITDSLRAGGFWTVDADTSLVELKLVDFLFSAFQFLAWCLIAVYFIGTFMKHKIASILALFGVFMILMNSLLSSLLYPLLNVIVLNSDNYRDILYSLPRILSLLLDYFINNCSGVIQLMALGFITLSFIFTIKERMLPSLLALAGMLLKMFISISILVFVFFFNHLYGYYPDFGGEIQTYLDSYLSLYNDIVVYLDPLSWLLLAVYFVSCLFPNKKEAAK